MYRFICLSQDGKTVCFIKIGNRWLVDPTLQLPNGCASGWIDPTTGLSVSEPATTSDFDTVQSLLKQLRGEDV